MNEREKLMKIIQTHDFALIDTMLYLDAYPETKSAIKLYNEQLALRTKYVAEYESKYGPITYSFDYEDHWDWVATPWPWEMEDC